ncbi:MAG: family 65 glycosyl hydrolase, partial [Spirochaetes bacterium]
LAYILLGGEGRESTLRNSFKYYESITTHDSSLSYAAFSILAAQLGDPDKAYEYFAETAALDLDDSHKNTRDGIHVANMGGAWLATVWGFGGFRPAGPIPSFSPRLPSKWKTLSFRIHYRASSIEVQAARDKVRLNLRVGPPIDVEVYGSRYRLESELIVSVDRA